MDPIICPVCETPNAEDAQHCEVCGERLTPPGPGEEVPPEENVAAMIEEEPDYPEEALEALSQAEDDDEPPLDSGPDLADDYDAPLDSGPDLPDEFDGGETFEEPVGRPAVLFSSIDGTAYPEGTPEYEEGFGPMGEELVATPPDDVASNFDATSAEEDPSAYDTPDDEFQPEPVNLDQPSSARFEAVFTLKEKERPSLAPLPQPGTFVEPATVTIYLNREPIHKHYVETDETLIGRRDPMADAFPDLDLTDFDADAHVSRKHAYIYRQNKNYTLYVVSNAGTQLNSDLLDLGDRRPLTDGDVIVLAGKIAMKFEIPEAHA